MFLDVGVSEKPAVWRAPMYVAGGCLDMMDCEEYNRKAGCFGTDFRALNRFVMDHTLDCVVSDSKLSDSLKRSISGQYVLLEGDDLDVPESKRSGIVKTIVSKKRSFEAASAYKVRKTCVLNFANNHSVGGSPWTAGAQEESICRTSTLYPCLKAAEKDFHIRHQHMYAKGEIGSMGNDDLIYTPKVCVFKSDESAPKMLDESDWFEVDVISAAAPQLSYAGIPQSGRKDYERIMRSRIRRILDVASKEGEEVLVLGAFGCGAFHNPPDIVAEVFRESLADYDFGIVEFAVFCRDDAPDSNYEIFKKAFSK